MSMIRTETVDCPVCGAPAEVTWSGIADVGFDTPRREDAIEFACPNGHGLDPTALAEAFPRIIHRAPRPS